MQWKNRRFHLSTVLLLCLFLIACRGKASTTQTKLFTPTATSTPSLVQPSTETTTAAPQAYPPPSTPIYPPPGRGISPLKPALQFTPTPVVHWHVPVAEVSWDEYSAVSQPGWLSNTIAKLAIYPAGSSYITVDIATGKKGEVSDDSGNSGWKIPSPQNSYVIECTGSVLKMIRVKDHRLVSDMPLTSSSLSGVVCAQDIHWSLDGSVASFVIDEKTVYIWKSDGTQPVKVGETTSPKDTTWSPDSQKLVIVTAEPPTHLDTLEVFDRDGNLLRTFQFQANGDGVSLGWLTNEVLASYSRYTDWYYDIRTGQFLFSWTSMPNGNGIFHQDPEVSPDNRWVFLDQGNEDRMSTFDHTHIITRKEYHLYDLQAAKSYVLLDNWGTYLGYAGWNSDSTTLYVLSRPAEAVSTPEPATPYGLLGYDVQTHEYHTIFKDAVQVYWNTDKSWAFVVFAASGNAGQLGLDGGLWKVGSTTPVSQWHISDQLVYQDPARDSFFTAFPGPVSTAWSHNNQYVAVYNKYGQLRLLGIDGRDQGLTDELPSNKIGLYWSPDDQHLLVSMDHRAWIVNMSNP